LKTEALVRGRTLSLWAKLAKPTAQDQVFIGARGETGELAFGSNLGGTGFAIVLHGGGQPVRVETGQTVDGQWHQLVATLSPGAVELFVDGRKVGNAVGGSLPADASIFLGSEGKAKFAAATLDEVRIYDRVLSEEEIRGLSADRNVSAP
jgi:Concanavalin A-like lectin/glucanases superfamily